MDAGFNSVLDLLQAVTLPQVGRNQSGKDGGGDPFAKLMEQQRQMQKPEVPADSAQESTETPAAPEAPQGPKAETDEVTAETAGQMQMAWAALAMVNPPVQAETAEAAAAEPAVETVVMPEMAAAVETDAAAEQMPETAETVELPEAAAEVPVETKAEETAEPLRAETPHSEAPKAQSAAEAPVHTQVKRQEAPEAEAETEVTVREAVEAPQPLFRDTEAIPVKVSEAELPRQEAEPVAKQLTKPILEAAAQGESRVAVQLTPENLGSVTVEITRSSDGSLHVSLSAERVQTQGLLERHASSLQTMLADRNQGEVRVEVQRQEESGAYQPYDGRNGHSQQQQQQQRQEQGHHGQDFLQQLRLGLIPAEEL